MKKDVSRMQTLVGEAFAATGRLSALADSGRTRQNANPRYTAANLFILSDICPNTTPSKTHSTRVRK